MELRPKNKKLHRKALEILSLSRNISNYLGYDLSPLRSNGSENSYIYFTGDIIRQSDSLAPQILQAENQHFQQDRIAYARTLRHITNRIYKNCERLEKSESNGRDFIILLRRELKKFKRLQHHWMTSL